MHKIPPEILEKAKQKLSIQSFNAMQESAFEMIPSFKDCFLIAATGSGKTLAFLLPILSLCHQDILKTQALIIAPTRELSLQLESVARALGLGFSMTSCYGGHPIRFEKKVLESRPQIIFGTPGRLQDHLDRKNIELDYCRHLVLDEFDKTLEMGFHTQMKSIFSKFPVKPQIIMTSATEMKDLPDFLPSWDIQKIKSEKEIQKPALRTWKVASPQKDKLKTLQKLLHDIGNESCFVFCNFRETVERVHEFLSFKKIPHDHIHGGMDQIERENIISKFRNGTTRILISTDLTGRGLDITGVDHVVHYHLPITAEIYTHRNGRTARMGKSGNIYIILHPHEELPEFIQAPDLSFEMSNQFLPIEKPEWLTLWINRGKRDKISKGDIAGFLHKSGKLTKEELGIIEVKKMHSLAAIKRNHSKKLPDTLEMEKLKGKSIRVKWI